MRHEAPTKDEATFFERLSELIPGAQDWYHADDDGALWMTVSYDDVVNGVMKATWRCDFDGSELVAGRSPAHLNWDDGVRGRTTGMDLAPPTGLVAGVDSVEQAVRIAAEWFNTVSHGRASL